MKNLISSKQYEEAVKQMQNSNSLVMQNENEFFAVAELTPEKIIEIKGKLLSDWFTWYDVECNKLRRRKQFEELEQLDSEAEAKAEELSVLRAKLMD